MAQIVYSRSNGDGTLSGDLFSGLKFFIAQRCPFRHTFVDKVSSNGGDVVKLEQHADYFIADDLKKNLNPPGAISYKFIDDSIKRGRLVDANDAAYIAGPEAGAIRPVASERPGKFGRTPFTLADKVQLYEWVQGFREKGGSVRGNEIYKQLERINPRHTFQAWRDHYIKQLEGKPHPGNGTVSVQNNAPPTPPIDHQSPLFVPENDSRNATTHQTTTVTQPTTSRQAPPPQRTEPVSPAAGYLAEDINDLLLNADDILDTRVRNEDKAWEAWAKQAPEHTGREWKSFWENLVRPLFEEQEDNQRRIKIYNKHWLKWYQDNLSASADAWLDYYNANVKPLYDVSEEETAGTPTKRNGGPQVKPRISDASIEQKPAPSKRSFTASQTESGEHQSPMEPPNKRLRSDGPAGTEEAPVDASVGAEQGEEDAAMREFLHISEDERDQSQSPSKKRSRGAQKKRLAQDTQAIVDESQDIDFDVPEPEEGSQTDPLGAELAAQSSIAVYNEDEDDAALAFDMPSPGDGAAEDGDEWESAQPDGYITAPESQTQRPLSASPSKTPYLSLAARVGMLGIRDLMTAGYDGGMIHQAATSTSADPRLFKRVLNALMQTGKIPEGIRGVWTEKDDLMVEGTDARRLKALEEKHGSDGLHSIEGRLNFLSEWRA